MQPIQWKEQPGLYDAIIAAGHYVEHAQDGSFADDVAAVQAIIDTYTPTAALAYAIESKSRLIALHAKRLRDRIVAEISPAELSSWSVKLNEAAAYVATGSADAAPMLSAEAQARGVSLDTLIVKVHDNARRFQFAEAAIAGADGKHRDAVRTLTSAAAVVAYDYADGWPEI